MSGAADDLEIALSIANVRLQKAPPFGIRVRKCPTVIVLCAQGLTHVKGNIATIGVIATLVVYARRARTRPFRASLPGTRGKAARPSRIYSTISEGPGMRHFTPTIHEIVIDTETTTMSQAMSE